MRGRASSPGAPREGGRLCSQGSSPGGHRCQAESRCCCAGRGSDGGPQRAPAIREVKHSPQLEPARGKEVKQEGGKESWSQGLHSTSPESEQLGEGQAQEAFISASSIAPGGRVQGGQRSSKASRTWPWAACSGHCWVSCGWARWTPRSLPTSASLQCCEVEIRAIESLNHPFQLKGYPSPTALQ